MKVSNEEERVSWRVGERGRSRIARSGYKVAVIAQLCLHFVCYIKRCNKFFIKRNLEMLLKESTRRARAIKNGCGQQGVTAKAK